jgi:predicted RNA methylase
MAFDVQGFQQPNYQVNPVAGNKYAPQDGMTQLNNLLDYQSKNLALQKQQALQQPQIEAGIAASQQAKTQAEASQFGLQKSYQTYAQGLVNGLINDPDVINGNKEGILKKLTAIEDFTSAVGMPKHPSGAIEQARKLAESDPTAVRDYFASRIVGGMESGGQAQQALVGAGQQQQVGGQDISGNPTIYQRDRFGNIVQTPLPVGGAQGQPFSNMRINPGETAETVQGFQAERALAKQSATAAQPALTNIQTVRKFLPLAQTGKYSEAISGMQSVLGNLAGDTAEEKAASARDIIQKNIADLAAQKNLALGGKFAADLNAAQESIASAGKNPTAILKSMQQLEPLIQHSLNYQQGLEKVIANPRYGIQAKRKYDNEMIDAFDPQAMMVYNAYKSGDTKDFESLTKGMSDTKKREILTKMNKYNSLVNGEL